MISNDKDWVLKLTKTTLTCTHAANIFYWKYCEF